jgi:membrane protein DedA with SNARE-associated domain
MRTEMAATGGDGAPPGLPDARASKRPFRSESQAPQPSISSGEETYTVENALAVLVSYGYVILAVFVVAEQVPLPVPAVPVLLGIGALAAEGRMSIGLALAIACAAALPVDLVWRRLGAVRGTEALRSLCRLALEPDSCIRRSETLFERYGSPVLLIAKFVPGLTALAPAMAGLVKVRLARFLALDIAGIVLWAGTWMSLGYLFSHTLQSIVTQATRAGSLLGALAAGFIIYALVKIVVRRRLVRQLRAARITTSELKVMLDRGEDVWIDFTLHHPGSAMDRGRGDNPRPRGHPARSGHRAGLHVTGRSDERPCGADAQAKGHHARPALARRAGRLAEAGVFRGATRLGQSNERCGLTLDRAQ